MSASERENALAGLRASVGTLDPLTEQAVNYGRGMKAVQEVVKEQGQVMSLTLQNNELLYHTNKKLNHELGEARGEASSAKARERRALEQLEVEKKRFDDYAAKIEAAGGDRYKALYENAKQVLSAYLFDSLTSEQLKERLAEMAEQAKEIEAMPNKITPEELQAWRES